MNDGALHKLLLKIQDGITSEFFTEAPATWTVGSSNGEIYIFPEARRAYFPGPEKPEAVVILKRESLHIFEYHSVEYLVKTKPEDHAP